MARSPGCNTSHGPAAGCPHRGERGAGSSRRWAWESILHGLPHVARASRAGSLPPEEWRKARLAVRLGLDSMTADGAVASPGDPRQRCESPRRVHCCSGPALRQKTLKRGAPAPEFADGLDGRGSSRRRKSEGSSLPRLPGAGGPARPYLGGGVRGSDGRVPWRSRRRLRRGAAAAGLGFGRRRAPSLRLLRAPLLRGAPGPHGFSAILPRPAAGLRLLQIAGTRNRAKEAVRPEVPRAPSSPAPPPNAPSLRMKETRSRQTP